MYRIYREMDKMWNRKKKNNIYIYRDKYNVTNLNIKCMYRIFKEVDRI